MAQSGFTPIKLYLSTTAAAVPLAADLAPGELAINNNDGKLFYEDSSGVVQVIATKAGASGDVVGPASATANAVPSFSGTTGKLIQNNSGVTISTGVVTATGFAGPLNGSVGATTPAAVTATQVDITAQGDLRLQDTTGGQYVALQAPGTVAASYTLTLPVDDGTAGQALVTDGNGVLSWSTAASGDVYGPASATDNAVARYDGTTGKIIQNSAVTIADDGATVIAANSASDGLRITQLGAGNALLVEDSANPDSSPFVIDQSGVVGIGTTTPQSTFGITAGLGIQSSTAFAPAFIQRNKANDTSAPYYVSQKDRAGAIVQSGDFVGTLAFQAYDGASYLNVAYISAQVDGTPGTNDMPGRLLFYTTADGASSPTERMRINSAGEVGIGVVSTTAFSVRSAKNATGAATTYGIAQQGTVLSDSTASHVAMLSNPATQAAAFTLSNLYHFLALQGTFGATSAVTNQYGFRAEASLTGATNNYGFYGNIASGTGRWNFYAAGTADNYFAGSTAIGTTSTNTGYGSASSLNLANASSVTFNNASNAWNTTTAGGSITYWTNNALFIDAKDSDGQVIFRVNGTTTRATIASSGTISLGAAVGSESLRVTPVASAVNYLNVSGAVTTGSPVLSAAGSDTNIGLTFTTKGTGSIVFNCPSTVFAFSSVSGADFTNYFTQTGSLTYAAAGSSTDINFVFTAKGAGNLNLKTGGGTQFLVANTTSAVNFLQVTGAATGGNVSIAANGADTNIGNNYVAKGTGQHFFYSNSSPQFLVSNTASAVNYLQVAGGATGGGPTITTQGTDTNVAMFLSTKGAGQYFFSSSSSTQFNISNTASAVNYLRVAGAIATAAPALSAQGSDTNIDLVLTPKGTGVLAFGTYTAGVVAQAGYITIKDAGGTTRRLLVG